MDIETTFPVRMEQVVEWGDVDSFGHVNNCKYFRYFENVRLLYFQRMALMGTEAVTYDPSGQGPILARIGCDFRAPLFYPDRIRIECGATRIGRSSFGLAYRIFSEAQQAVVAEADSVIVYYDYAARASRALPHDLVARLKAIEDAG